MTARTFRFVVQAPAATYLAQQSQALVAGQWSSALWPTNPSQYGWNTLLEPSGDAYTRSSILQDEAGSGQTAISYAGIGCYDPNYGVCFVGSGVGGGPSYADGYLRSWVTRYNETTNVWTKRNDPCGEGQAGGIGHQYYCNANNPNADVHYRLQHDTTSAVRIRGLARFRTSTGVFLGWKPIPSPFTLSSIPGAIACAEDWGSQGRCVVIAGPDNSFAVMDEASGNYVYNQDFVNIDGAMDIHPFATYHKGTNKIVYGSGNDSLSVWTMDSSFVRVRKNNAPYPVTGGSTVKSNAKVLDLGHPTKLWVIFHSQPGAPVYVFDINANTWTQTADVVPAKSLAEIANTYAVPLRQYGTVLWMFNRAGTNFTAANPDLREEVAYLFKPLAA